MKEFNVPVMSVQKLNAEEIISTSGCLVEAKACLECYCIAVQCSDGYECTSLVCPILDEL